MIHQTLQVWEKGQYGGEGPDGFAPTLDTYIVDGSKNRPAVLICPGGGYEFTSPREAEPIALQFVSAGFHAFVLYYSVAPRKHPQPLLDVSKAMAIIRDHAEQWRVESQKIAVCGFSAGGHLAASLGVHWEKADITEAARIDAGANRPNALILCYPVISSGPYAHRGSFVSLLGAEAGPSLLHQMSLEHQVNPGTPPTFIWHTFDDSAVPVENSLMFAQGLRGQNIPFELHIYPHGPHGLSLATKETDESGQTLPHIAGWVRLCVEWLEQLFQV